jgi:FkbM family methyltransferase
VWARLPGVDWKVRVRIVRHAAYYLAAAAPEPQSVALLTEINRMFAPHSFWDVGANIGYYSWFLKSQAPGLEVRLFEPDPQNLQLIEATIHANRIPNATLRPVAVTDCAGGAELAIDELTGASSTLERMEASFCENHWGVRGASLVVPAVSIDSERRETAPVHLIKIDVEGHEESVFRGACETLSHDQPIILAECFHGGSCLVGNLRRHDYLLLNTERMDEDLSRGCNFLALPARYRHALRELRSRWSAAASEAGGYAPI